MLRGRFGYIECRPLFDLSPRGQAATPTMLPGTRLFLPCEAIHEEFNFKAPFFFGGILTLAGCAKHSDVEEKGAERTTSSLFHQGSAEAINSPALERNLLQSEEEERKGITAAAAPTPPPPPLTAAAKTCAQVTTTDLPNSSGTKTN